MSEAIPVGAGESARGRTARPRGAGVRAAAACLALAAGLLAFVGTSAAAEVEGLAVGDTVDIPRLEGIAIDGDARDWGEQGFEVGVLPNDEGQLRPVADFDAGVRLGWSDEGLLVLVDVSDDVGLENASEDDLWDGDSIELFAAPDWALPGHCQFIISPGLDARFPDSRMKPYDRRLRRDEDLKAEVAVTKCEDGYVCEALLPWSNIAITPELGTEIGFQVFVNDYDVPGDVFDAVWCPRQQPGAGSRATQRLRLADAPSAPVVASAQASYERMRRIRVEVVGVGGLAGKPVELREGASTVAAAELAADGGHATAKLLLPLPPRGRPVPEMAVFIGGERLAPVELPDVEQVRARALLDLGFNFHPSVFSTTTFPRCEFDQLNLAEDVLGNYRIETAFYDGEYRLVTRAEKPGRYGAVVEVIPEAGRPVKLFRTLFRLPAEGTGVAWYPYGSGISVELPGMMEVDAAVLAEQSGAINEAFWRRFQEGFESDAKVAALLAGLYEASPRGARASVQDDVFAQDRQWWVGLKRRLYGMEEMYAARFACPRRNEGPPAPVLRAGTAEEAGMSADGVDKIDALLEEWAADSDQGFAVCLARHGVVFLHKAYGERDGRPMTVTDKSYAASITKLLSGTLMMMVVDQGRVDLDDRVGKFLPAFRGVEAETPLTIRHLYTHTNGLWDHWGDDLHDLEQLIGSYYPYLEVGKRFRYNGAGYALGGKVIEVVSGEAIPLFYKHHLLDPLGCKNVDVSGTSWDACIAPMDLAKVGQMLLNRGAYGDMRFFSEETFRQMLPERLTRLLGPHATAERGIGLSPFSGEGLGEGTFGHAAGSDTTLRIDPVNDLVIVMMRNAAGSNFGAYHAKFLKAVVDGIADTEQGREHSDLRGS